MFARTFRVPASKIKQFAKKNSKFLSMGAVAGGVGLAVLANCTEVARADEKPMFVINGFYMQMREAYTAPGKSIHFMTVEWPESALAWEDFRGKVLGATDPKKAAAGSVRNDIFLKYKELGLKGEPNTGDNGVHASASPFEAMAERSNWLSVPIEDDYFGAALLKAGIPKKTLVEWTYDPQVSFDGGKASLFDLLEDMNASECLAKAIKISGASAGWGTPKVEKNTAYVFVKPHAVPPATIALVKNKFASNGIAVTSEGSLDSKEIDEKKLIDQHYYSIANKATLSKPKDLNPPAKKTAEFAKMFGMSWEKALADGLVYNAADACKELGVDGGEMNKLFGAAKKGGNSIKFGGGFYCAKIDTPKKSGGILATIKSFFGGK
mmetsp:Transcript_18753/g.29798  ORF Transcript_18753/g.29798 Transcript_18753/m.29798 type:complete len:380 (-) Transcript_18753:209-1348(-)